MSGMDLGLAPEQESFAESLRDLLDREGTSKQVRDAEQRDEGFLPELWGRCVEMGIPRLALPPPFGEGGLIDAVLAAFELGRAVAPVPYLSNSFLPGRLLAACPSGTGRDRLLADIAAGGLVAAGLLETGQRDADREPVACAVDGATRLHGEKVLVRFPEVGRCLVTARDRDGAALYFVDGSDGVAVTRRRGIDPAPLGDVSFRDAAAVWLGPFDQTVLRATGESRVAVAGWLAGAADRLVAMSVAYARGRVQFDRPIGSFQAVQHRLADVAVGAQAARLMALRAASLADAGRLGERDGLRSWLFAGDAARAAAAAAHQVFGGYGFTVDHDVQLYSRRVKAAQLWNGDPLAAEQRLGALWRAGAGRLPGRAKEVGPFAPNTKREGDR